MRQGSADGVYALGPLSSPKPPPDGDLVAPRAGPVGGLTLDEVQGIINAAVAEANLTRAVIRLPIGSRARMVMAVSDLDGTIIALHRMADATVFSIDVAVAKARNVIFFSGPNRTRERSAGRSHGYGGNQPNHRLRRAADLSAGNRPHRTGSIFPALSIRHAESVHAGVAGGESESKRHRVFPRRSAVV